jgi:ABC-type multidrug transport system fused ATPase/permease subunit
MENLKSLKRIYDQLMYILTGKQKREAVIVFISMIALSLLELIGVTAIYPFLQVMMDADELRGKWYSGWIYAVWPEITNTQIVVLFGVVLILVYVFKNIFALICTYIQYRFAASYKRVSAKRMIDSYMKRPYEYFVNTNSGVILRGITSDTSATYIILCEIFEMFSQIMIIIVLGIYLMVTDLFIALGALILAAVCFFALVFGFKGLMKRTGKEYREALAKQNQYAYQAINGVKEITVADRREHFVKVFDGASRQVEHADIVNSFVTACPDRIIEGVCVAGMIGIVCIKVLIGTDISEFIPILGTFAVAAFKMLPAISKISSRLNGIIYRMPGLQSCYDNLKQAEQYDDEMEKLETAMVKSDTMSDIRFDNCLEVNNIVWKYRNSKAPVLNGLSMRINKGESVAFIGSSGAGKTTLADVILGLLIPQSGSVKMDGVDIHSIPREWAHIIGYIPQSVYLIDDTVRANVAFGLPSENISDNKIWDALKKAQLDEFIESLPKGLDTIVGERGVKFSGGQRQRIAIARALYEDPDILVLDEATSALDNETETAVMESIDSLQGSKTLIIVAHRLSTIRNCDRIYEVKDGIAMERDKDDVLKC